MIPRIKIVLLTFSILLVLGHSFMPHRHRETDCDAIHLKCNRHLSLADLLKVTLSGNLGKDHLQVFKILDEQDVLQENRFENRSADNMLNEIAESSCADNEPFSTSRLLPTNKPLLSSFSLRAPPRHT